MFLIRILMKVDDYSLIIVISIQIISDHINSHASNPIRIAKLNIFKATIYKTVHINQHVTCFSSVNIRGPIRLFNARHEITTLKKYITHHYFPSTLTYDTTQHEYSINHKNLTDESHEKNIGHTDITKYPSTNLIYSYHPAQRSKIYERHAKMIEISYFCKHSTYPWEHNYHIQMIKTARVDQCTFTSLQYYMSLQYITSFSHTTQEDSTPHHLAKTQGKYKTGKNYNQIQKILSEQSKNDQRNFTIGKPNPTVLVQFFPLHPTMWALKFDYHYPKNHYSGRYPLPYQQTWHGKYGRLSTHPRHHQTLTTLIPEDSRYPPSPTEPALHLTLIQRRRLHLGSLLSCAHPTKQYLKNETPTINLHRVALHILIKIATRKSTLSQSNINRHHLMNNIAVPLTLRIMARRHVAPQHCLLAGSSLLHHHDATSHRDITSNNIDKKYTQNQTITKESNTICCKDLAMDIEYDNGKPRAWQTETQMMGGKNPRKPSTCTACILECRNRGRLYGGGRAAPGQRNHPPKNPTYNTVTRLPAQNNPEDKWVALPTNILQINFHKEDYPHSNDQHNWRPAVHLPHQRSVHALTDHIQEDTLKQIYDICQLPPSHPILRTSNNKRIELSVKDLQDVVSYGSEINDTIVIFFLELICHPLNITFLYPDFLPRLRQHGWSDLLRYFANPQRRTKARSIYRPDKAGEPTILIPLHVQNSHWIALARKKIGHRTYFLYSDDMNNTNEEENLRKLIFRHTDQGFCPPDAIWINCSSTYYVDHSNECGPRTLLALYTMATHPHPYKEMLLPLMHQNLAQICRTWIATSLLTGQILDTALTEILRLKNFTNNRTSNTGQSIPTDIINWDNYAETRAQTQIQDRLDHPCIRENLQQMDPDISKSSRALSSIGEQQLHPMSSSLSNYDPRYDKNIIKEEYWGIIQENNTPLSTQDTRENTSPTKPRKILQQKITEWTINTHEKDIQETINNIDQYGTPLQPIDSAKKLRIVMQNTYNALQLTNDPSEYIQIINNLQQLEASIFMAISPNINWCNPSHKAQFKHPFLRAYRQVHISSTSSAVGYDKNYFQRPTLPGGAAILTFNHWASKVTDVSNDIRGHGTFTVTTIEGKNKKKLSIIAAYISVKKGSQIGVNTVHAQQTYVMEKQQLKENNPAMTKCPRKEAIRALSTLIDELQEKDHAIILALDANQTPGECHTSTGLKKHSIEWLKVEHDLSDPFVEITGNRPPTTTMSKGRDIDYIYTHGVKVTHITTLPIDNPANSDHIGIAFDIDTSLLFNAQYSTLGNIPQRKLTVNNIKAKTSYIQYLLSRLQEGRIKEQTVALEDRARSGHFGDAEECEMNLIDDKLSQILIPGENQCNTNLAHRNPWSPKLCNTGKALSYWKKKWKMARQKCFVWKRLDNIVQHINISHEDHINEDLLFIRGKLRDARSQWKQIKKEGDTLRLSHLQERATEHAKKMNTTAEKALKAIIRSEQTKKTYKQIRTITGHKTDKNPLTQVDVPSPIDGGQIITVTTKEDLESSIISRNQNHARQSLQTPFATVPALKAAVNPQDPANKIENILDGSFLEHHLNHELPDIEKQWIQELERRVTSNINVSIELTDFISFFKNRKEKTASSASGRHMGHYKVIAELATQGITEPAEIIISLINISIATSRPLKRWKRSSQVMLEKGKGRHIEQLRIIQLCEADLNFALNIIWGYRLIRHAINNKAFNKSQYALPGSTCNSAVWNKMLYCDLI
jgi:hypothetical protein